MILSIIVFIRLKITMFVFLKRGIPWEEALSIPFAFGLYYFGYALLGFFKEVPLDIIDYSAIVIFLIGSYLNTGSEWRRHIWKKRSENNEKLYTQGFLNTLCI